MAQDVTISTAAYADGAILTEAKLDTTFAAVETVIENVLNGVQAFDSILANATAEAVVIATGVATITRMYATLTSQTGTTDDVDTITITNGKLAFIRATATHTITLKHGTGNITIDGGSDVVITGNETALVFAAGSQVGVIGYGAAGGGVTASSTDTFTNKTIDADGTGNVITNIGSSEVKAELITGLTADATPVAATDYVMTYDASATALKKVLMSNLPTGAGASYAILRDEKTTGTNGGSASATTWNNRNLNTETYDPDAIVAIASNQFTPIAGDYIIQVKAVAFNVNQHRLRLYNVTGATSVEEGLNTNANAADDTPTHATLYAPFTANGTDAYRIDHYTNAAQATNGLGIQTGDGSPECYLEILLTKVA